MTSFCYGPNYVHGILPLVLPSFTSPRDGSGGGGDSIPGQLICQNNQNYQPFNRNQSLYPLAHTERRISFYPSRQWGQDTSNHGQPAIHPPAPPRLFSRGRKITYSHVFACQHRLAGSHPSFMFMWIRPQPLPLLSFHRLSFPHTTPNHRAHCVTEGVELENKKFTSDRWIKIDTHPVTGGKQIGLTLLTFGRRFFFFFIKDFLSSAGGPGRTGSLCSL